MYLFIYLHKLITDQIAEGKGKLVARRQNQIVLTCWQKQIFNLRAQASLLCRKKQFVTCRQWNVCDVNRK